MGPGAWKGAKKAIEDAPGNVIYATKTRVLLKKEEQAPNTPAVYLMFLVLFVVLVSIFLQFLQNTWVIQSERSPQSAHDFKE